MTRLVPFALLAVVAALPPGPRDGPRPARRTMAVTVDDLPAMPSADLGEMRRAFEAFLAEHGYAVAPFTIENADYIFDLLRRNAAGQGDSATVDRLRATYVEHSLAVTEHMEAVARETFGREVPQVLLVHANGTNAAALDLEPDPPAWVLDLYRKAQER